MKTQSLVNIALAFAMSGCVMEAADHDAQAHEQGASEVEGLTQSLTSLTIVGNVTGGRDEFVTFDSSNAFLASTYQSLEFCDESQSRVLLQKMSLSTGTRTTLLQGTNLCSVAAKHVRSDGTHAYYVRSGSTTTIRRVTVATPATDALVVSEAATSLAVDGTNLYWTTGSLRKRAKSGGTITTLFTPPTGSAVTILGTDASHVFFDQTQTGFQNCCQNQVHLIRKVPIAGGTATTVRTLTTGRAITGFALDANNVYWADRAYGNTLNGAVRRISKTGAGLHTIATSTSRDFGDVAVTSSKVYWVERPGFDSRDPARIRSRTSPASNAGTFINETALRDGIGSSSDLKVNGTRMFWSERGRSTPHRVVRGTL